VSAYPITNTAPLVAQVPAGSPTSSHWRSPGKRSTARRQLQPPITLTITDAGIVAGDTVYEVTSSGLIVVGTASANGVVSITFTNDPTFVVAAALVSQSPISITSLNGEPGTALSLVTSGGQGPVRSALPSPTEPPLAVRSRARRSRLRARHVCGDRHEGSGRHLLECVLDASVTFRKAKVVPSASPRWPGHHKCRWSLRSTAVH